MWRFLAWAAALILTGATPALAEWRRAESPNFVLYGNASEATLRARILLLEDFDKLLRTLTSTSESASFARLHIYIADGPDSLRTVRPLPPGVAGFYAASTDGIAAFVDGRADREGNHILFHEYVHHFMRRTTSNTYPTWYSEGFAEYFATVRFSARRIDIGNFERGRVYSILEGSWLPMDRILGGGVDGMSRDQAAQFYAQSWLLVHYFYSTPERQAALRRLLAAQRRTDNAAEALQSATGLTPQQLNDELRRYIRDGSIRYRQMARASAGTPPPVVITALPASAPDMILVEGALRIGIPEEHRQPTLQRARAVAARHPNDPLAMRVLAHLELLYGDPAAADRLLDPLIAASPNDVELLYFKGLRYLVAANGDNPPDDAAALARQWLERAAAADGSHFQTLYRLAESRRGASDYVSASTSALLARAHGLAPQVPSITLNAAAMLIALRRHDEAIRMLLPLVLSPHDRGPAAAAYRMMSEAAARRAGPPPPGRDAQEPAEDAGGQ